MPLPESVALALAAHLEAWPAVAVTLPWREPSGRPETARLLFTTRERTALGRTYCNRHVWKPALVAARYQPLRVYAHLMPSTEAKARVAVDRALGGSPVVAQATAQDA